jgi:hypothetical protein
LEGGVTDSIFGPLFSADELEEPIRNTLSNWFATYKKEFELQHGMTVGSLPEIRAFATAAQMDRDNAASLPAIVVVSPGLGGKVPRQEGDGTFTAFFTIGVGIFVSAKDRASTTRILRFYCAIIRTIMLQKQSHGGIASGTTWLDESYDDSFNFTDGQTIQAGKVIFEIGVSGVVSRHGGPAAPTPPDPNTQPGSEWPLYETVSADVDVKE